jgi:hypothetical protein
MPNQINKLSSKIIFLTIIGFITLCLFPLYDDIFAGGIVKKDGMLTSIEKDGSLIIDEQGYLISPSVKIFNDEGRHTTLKSITLPSRIYFHYEYTNKGPVIKVIKVYPKVIPK